MSNQVFHYSNSGISSGQRFYLKDEVSGIFLNKLNINSDSNIVAKNLVYNTGDQTISGVKNFSSLPTVNGTGIFLNGKSILSTQISDSTTAGRTLLTATVQGQRTALEIFVSAANLAAFPASGNFQRIYLALDTAKTYVWNGSGYTEVSPNTHTRAGSNNTNVGETALASASLSGGNNTAAGAGALQGNTTGSNNTAVGLNALSTNQAASNSSAFGQGALQNSTGGNNTALGRHALGRAASTQATNNTAAGTNAGDALTIGSENTIIGSLADADANNRSRCIVLGYSALSPAVNGSLAIGGAGGNAMGGLITGANGVGATSYLRIWLNGVEYRIAAVANL